MRQSTNYRCGWSCLDRNIAGIERAEVVQRQHRASVFRRLEIEIDEFVDGAALQKAQHLAQCQRRGHSADERRADGLAGEERDATAIEHAVAIKAPAKLTGFNNLDG
jgi:hypothetical protein